MSADFDRAKPQALKQGSRRTGGNPAPGNLWVSADFDREGLEALLGEGSAVLKP